MVLLAYALWNGAGGLRVAELVALDSECLALVGSLFQALSHGPDAIDAWLERAAALRRRAEEESRLDSAGQVTSPFHSAK